jgi:hypothetical protein
MRYFFAIIFGVLEVLIFGPAEAVARFFGFFWWGNSPSRLVVDEIIQDHRDAQWKREFLADKELEKNRRNPFLDQNQQQQTSRNPFLNQPKTKSMQWGRSSMKRKSKP